MPNGDPNPASYDRTLAGYERFFAPIGPTLIELARKYNFFLEKYYHEAPCWSLCFSPPQGGCVKLDTCRASGATVSILGVWWMDDYDQGTRSLKRTSKTEVERDPTLLESSVIATLKEVLAFRPGDWTQIVTGYREIWSRTWTKE